MDIFEKIRALKLDTNNYVIVAGGVLVALGLLDWDDDIDMAVTTEVFDTFKTQGWSQESWQGKTVLKHDIYDVGVGFGGWSIQELQLDAMIIKDIPFMSLDKLLAWKRQTGRQKDMQHIQLIEMYLASSRRNDASDR